MDWRPSWVPLLSWTGITPNGSYVIDAKINSESQRSLQGFFHQCWRICFRTLTQIIIKYARLSFVFHYSPLKGLHHNCRPATFLVPALNLNLTSFVTGFILSLNCASNLATSASLLGNRSQKNNKLGNQFWRGSKDLNLCKRPRNLQTRGFPRDNFPVRNFLLVPRSLNYFGFPITYLDNIALLLIFIISILLHPSVWDIWRNHLQDQTMSKKPQVTMVHFMN